MAKSKLGPPQPYTYGKSPNPTSWYGTADIIKANLKGVKKPTRITDQVDAIQKLLAERK